MNINPKMRPTSQAAIEMLNSFQVKNISACLKIINGRLYNYECFVLLIIVLFV